MSSNLSPVAMQQLRRMATDFRYFGRNCVKIEGKKPGEVINLEFTEAQEIVHEAAETMLAEVGYIRLIIVKGRQQGVSTYIEIRLLWKGYFNPNTKVCIISHEAKSSQALYDKVKFALDNLPEPMRVKPNTDNALVLELPNRSRFVVLTAGSKESGRSQTAHHQHQSERAFFVDADKIDAGAGQIVATLRGTEVYKESTANGWNHFRQECLDALEGKGIFRVVFVPWYLQKEYRHVPKPGFKVEEDEKILVELYGLDDAQLQWRRDKIVDLKSERLFKQEYPFTLMEAFQTSSGAFFDSILVDAARKSKVEGIGPMVLGVDPGRTNDRTVIALRRGRQLIKLWKYKEMDQMRLADILAGLIREHDVRKCFIDYAHGHGTVDQLRRLGFGAIVEGINFGESPINEVYLNKRAEMMFLCKEWMEDGEVSMPNDDDMVADFGAIPDFETTSHGKIKFPEKKEIKKTYGRSPDIVDAIILTFARPVRDNVTDITTVTHTRNTQRGSALSHRRRTMTGDY